MQKINLDETQLYNLIKRAVREVLEEEMFRHRLESLPFVTDEEMKEIEETYGKPRAFKNAGRNENFEI